MNAVSRTDIARYVEEVRAALADLPPAERDDLLEDLPDHLAEVAAEGEGSLSDRLGPPAAYAAELRASARLASPHGSRLATRLTTVVGEARRWLAGVDVKAGPILGYARASEFLRLLRPAWWVLRGYLAAMAFAFVFLGQDDGRGLLPRVGGNELFGLAFLVGCVLASIWLGRRPPGPGRWRRQLVLAGNAILVLAALAWFFDVDERARSEPYYDYDQVYSNPNEQVNDVYVYDSNGRPLTGVRLFDQDGRPIELGDPTWCEESASDTVDQIPPYPRCPDRAPWGSLPIPSTAPTAGPGPAATPTPTSTGSPSPAVGSPSPSPSPRAS